MGNSTTGAADRVRREQSSHNHNRAETFTGHGGCAQHLEGSTKAGGYQIEVVSILLSFMFLSISLLNQFCLSSFPFSLSSIGLLVSAEAIVIFVSCGLLGHPLRVETLLGQIDRFRV